MNKIVKFDASITEIKPLNSTFSLAKCRIFYVGDNRNGSSITKECAEEMAKTIAYTPVVGEWKEDIGNFGGHGGKITIKDGKVTYEDTTRPYGCVLDIPVWWETVEEDGIEKEYMCCYVALWTTRYPEAMKVIEDGSFQSMEISVEKGESRSDGFYQIDKAIFLGLCILGKDDENPENTTEPCFEDSTIESTNFEVIRDNFKKEFNLMLKDLKQNLLNNTSDFNIIEREVKENMENEPVKTPVNEPVVDPKKTQGFALSVQQIYTAIDKSLATKTVITQDWWGDAVEEQEFYSIDLITENNMVVAIDNATWSNYFGIPYTMNGDVAELDYANMKPYMRGEWREVEDGQSVPSPVNFSKVKDAFEKRLKSFSEKAVEKAKAETKAEFNAKETEEYKTLEGELATVKAQFEKAVESADEALKTENATLKQDYAKLEGELQTVRGEVSTKEADFTKVNEELEAVKADNAGLLEFKAKTEKAERVNAVNSKIAEFSFEEDEVKELKEKAYNAELSVDELSEKLFALEGMKAHKNKEIFSNKNENVKDKTTVKVVNTVSDENPYSSLAGYFSK